MYFKLPLLNLIMTLFAGLANRSELWHAQHANGNQLHTHVAWQSALV